KHVTPGEGEDRVPVEEVVPRLAEGPAELRLRAGCGQGEVGLHRLDVAGGLDQRLHIFRVEPVQVRIVRTDDERSGEGHVVEHALAADLEVHGDTVARGALAIEILATEEL